ncbi:hypothetical protein LguiB_018751 [Lonicera macranthoides]
MDHIKQIQSQAIQRGLTPDTHVYSKLIAFCCTNESGHMEYAHHLFDTILEPSVFVWNNMIKGFSRINCPTFLNQNLLFWFNKMIIEMSGRRRLAGGRDGGKCVDRSMVDVKSHEAASHDVFLSFRGEDTRKTFVDHLYEKLVDVGFRTFRDNEGIERGENIKSELERAILQSSQYENKKKKKKKKKQKKKKKMRKKSSLELGNRTRLWHYKDSFQVLREIKFLGLLKILDLSHSHELIRTPDFVLLPQLGRLILEDCVSLVEVHESIGNLDTKLIVLNLKDCINLRNLPRNICMLKALETLVISGCSNLGEFPKEIRKMESLKVFHADKIPMSPSASTTSEDGLWPALISKWVTRPRKCPKLSWDYLPYSIVSLSLSDCNLHDYSFPMDFSNLPSLKKLDLSLNPLCSLPDCIRGLTSLERLDMFSCKSLQELIDLPRITDLVLENCISLEKMTFQSKVYESKAPVPLIGGCKKLVHMEGSFKLETIKNLDNEVMKCLGMYQYDLQALNNFEVTLYNACTGTERKGPIQVLFERCITNIFLPEGEVPGWFSSKSVGSSISIIVPSFSSSNSKILGLNVFIVYAIDKHWHPNSLFYIVVSNQTKNLKFNYFPMCYGLLKPDEYITWSSHWKFHKSQMDIGDQLNISLATDPCFKVKEIGVRLVYDEQAHSSDDVVLMKALNRLGDTCIIDI